MTALLPAPRTTAVPTAWGTAQAVRLDGIERSFPLASGRRDVLRTVDLDISAGEIVAVVGPSGCGKSTLLRLVGGLDIPTRGSIRLDDTLVADVDERTAVAFRSPDCSRGAQSPQNVELGLPRGTARRAVVNAVRELLHLVGLDHAADQRPREVSGGMAQRASLARALAATPASSCSTSRSGRSTHSPACACTTCC